MLLLAFAPPCHFYMVTKPTGGNAQTPKHTGCEPVAKHRTDIIQVTGVLKL
jgi:hypothetical protein